MKKLNIKKEVFSILFAVLSGIVSALGLWIFVYPSNFAPSGVDGIATMLYELTGINAGIYTFALNLPLLIIAWFILKRRYVLYTVLYTIITSLLLVLLETLKVPQYVTVTDRLIPAIFGGVAQGFTGIMLRIGGSAGGVDVMACMAQKKMPHVNVERIIFILSIIIVGVSYFVYWDVDSLLLSIVEIFACERVTALILRDSRNAVKFEVITNNPDEVKEDIIYELNHGATILSGEGVFSGEGKSVIICVVSYRQISEFLKIVSKYPGSFAYYSDVMGVRGNFDWNKEEESFEDKQNRELKKKQNDK